MEVEYSGPNLPRQRIPPAELFRIAVGGSPTDTNLVNGLDYHCYEGVWSLLPEFKQLKAVTLGTVVDFDPRVRSRAENAGVQFSGFLRISQPGEYAFSTRSDDGSRLFVGESRVQMEVLGAAVTPSPRRITIGQVLSQEEDGQWVELEGRVTLAREQPGGLELELSAGAGRVRLELADADELSAKELLNRRIRATGFCQSATTLDGPRVPGVLLVPGGSQIEFLSLGAFHETSTTAATNTGGLPRFTTAAAVHALKREDAQGGYPVILRGVTTSVLPEDQAFTLQDATRGLYVIDKIAGRVRFAAGG